MLYYKYHRLCIYSAFFLIAIHRLICREGTVYNQLQFIVWYVERGPYIINCNSLFYMSRGDRIYNQFRSNKYFDNIDEQSNKKKLIILMNNLIFLIQLHFFIKKSSVMSIDNLWLCNFDYRYPSNKTEFIFGITHQCMKNITSLSQSQRKWTFHGKKYQWIIYLQVTH